MYQGIDTESLFRGHVRDLERYYKHLRRLDEIDGGQTTGPGWQSPATLSKRELVMTSESLRGRLLLRLGHVMRLTGARA